jgi:hypothetical protein
LLGASSVLSLTIACNFPVDADRFGVAEQTREDQAYSAELLAAHAAPDSECERCIEANCGDALTECARSEGCSELTICARREANPGATTSCSNALDVDLETRRSRTALAACAATCGVECQAGREFSCADEYSVPRPPKDSLWLAQKLGLAGLGTALANASVSVCPLIGDCAEPIATATTDESGYYAVEVDIVRDPVSLAGFRGYRLVDSAATGLARLEQNIPVWSDEYRETHVLHELIAAELLERFDFESRSVIFVQVFDCHGVGAGNIVLEVPNAPEARVLYVDPNQPSNADRTATGFDSEGSALIYDLEPGKQYELVARKADGGDVVARGEATVPGDYPVYFGLFPNPKEGPE